ERWSRVASCLATTAGLRPGRTTTPVPSFKRRVRAAAKPRPTTGSGVDVVVRSASHTESKRRSSMAAKAAESVSGSVSPSTPRLTPMRTFTAPSFRPWRSLLVHHDAAEDLVGLHDPIGLLRALQPVAGADVRLHPALGY